MSDPLIADTVRSLPEYRPTEPEIRGRVNGNAARAKSVYGFPDFLRTARTLEVAEKLDERIERCSGVFRCYLCDAELRTNDDWHLDHIVPLVLRGPHSTDNVEAACTGCNLGKGAKSLEEFLTPTEYRRFMDGGGPPPFKKMAYRPVEELWERSHALAKLFARRPREVPISDYPGKWNADRRSPGLDVRIAAALAEKRPRGAMALRELCDAIDKRSASDLDDNYWLHLMGMYDGKKNTGYVDRRLRPSPLVVPVRFGARARRKGFRLRDDAALRWINGAIGDNQRIWRFPDQDVPQQGAGLLE